MMKLEFDRVLDYVREGEQDPLVKEMLDRDPDGEQLLQQARQLLQVLRESLLDEEGSAPEVDAAFAQEEPAEFLELAAADVAHEETADMFDDEAARMSPTELKALAKMVHRASGSLRRLGQLRIVHWDDRIQVSYKEPTRPGGGPVIASLQDSAKSSTTYNQSASLRTPGRERRPGDAASIKGAGMHMSLPGTVQPGAPLRLEVKNTRLNMPARTVTMTFMPKHGAFSRAITDSKGVVELPMPETSGTLRIETKPPTLIDVQVKK
jgi:hypothetical protein